MAAKVVSCEVRGQLLVDLTSILGELVGIGERQMQAIALGEIAYFKELEKQRRSADERRSSLIAEFRYHLDTHGCCDGPVAV